MDTMICNVGVYKWTTPSGKIYVGSSVDLKQRKADHLKDLRKGNHKNRHLQNAFRKYGEENFSWEVLEHVSEDGLLLQREEFWIVSLRAADRKHGYNINPTATGGTRSAETRARMSAAQMGKSKGRILSAEHKAKISSSLMGKVVSPEIRAKLSASRKGMVFSAEHRAKLSASKKELCSSPEYKARIGASRKGRLASDSTRAKLSIATKLAWERRRAAKKETSDGAE